MTRSFFFSQMDRLKLYFGAHKYPLPRLQLIWAEVKDLPDQSLYRIVTWFMEKRAPHQAPDVSHFRDEAHRHRQQQFTQAVKAAGHQLLPEVGLEPAARQSRNPYEYRRAEDGLKKALDELGVKSLMDAIQKRRRTGGGK